MTGILRAGREVLRLLWNDHLKIAVITLRDIPVGEELCISYIDADTTTGRLNGKTAGGPQPF